MPDKKEWTLMFFLASDNMLAPSIVSQLKSIKDAGFHHDANVIVQFDPHTEGTPTHIFEVNLLNKLKSRGSNQIGFNPEDPYVRNLIEDKLWSNEKPLDDDNKTIRSEIKALLRTQNIDGYDPPQPEDVSRRKVPVKGEKKPEPRRHKEPSPRESLKSFLRFCRRNYPARHYMLFILGHGVVVGNDVFLYDEHAEYPSLTLTDLGAELESFKKGIGKNSALELISFHSCSVSSLEVVFELQGTANYMLASQGPAFVGSWPYRQMLIRLFKDLDAHGPNVKVREMLTKMFRYCMHQSSDFLMAGYSYQLTMCDLTKLEPVKEALNVLSSTLTKGLRDPLANDFIVLSHWRSQSFYQEMYTDLYDFCFCLHAKCVDFAKSLSNDSKAPKVISDLERACAEMMFVLSHQRQRQEFTANKDGANETMMMCSEFTGPSYQYSKGMSVYFPWTQPSEDSGVLEQYAKYKFTSGSSTWLDFLKLYFTETRRKSILDEIPVPAQISKEVSLQQEIANLICIGDAPYGQYSTLDKTDPRDKTGDDDCSCPSIKNYSRDTRRRRVRRETAGKMPIAGLFMNQLWGGGDFK